MKTETKTPEIISENEMFKLIQKFETIENISNYLNVENYIVYRLINKYGLIHMLTEVERLQILSNTKCPPSDVFLNAAIKCTGPSQLAKKLKCSEVDIDHWFDILCEDCACYYHNSYFNNMNTFLEAALTVHSHNELFMTVGFWHPEDVETIWKSSRLNYKDFYIGYPKTEKYGVYGQENMAQIDFFFAGEDFCR